jgi:thiol-disulfide isomerase/thioredoxin
MIKHQAALLFCCSVCLTGSALADPAQNRTLITSDKTEITLRVYPAAGKQLFIWQPSEHGTQSIDQRLAQQLAEQGIESWVIDLPESYFLPTIESSMDSIPASAYASLLTDAAKSGKEIIVGVSGRAVIPVLRGVRQWQLAQPRSRTLRGVIMLSPNVFTRTPDPGEAAEIMPIAEASNVSLVILQPDKSPWYWKLEQTVTALRHGGSSVAIWRLADLRDRFYFRPDATEQERQAGEQLALKLHQAITLLGPRAARLAPTFKSDAPTRTAKQDRVLTAYRGNPIPAELKLPTLDHKIMDLQSLHGKVVLVNFWASWCPPCVFEMPSMQRLQDHFGPGSFVILGVNMAEQESIINDFVHHQVKINFPILLDQDGTALQRWQVFAFPTSYVVDKKGKIRYALFGGLEWDTPDIQQKIAALIQE